jgi:hypothetical protein
MKHDAIRVTPDEWKEIVGTVDRAIEVSLLSGSPDPAMAQGRNIIRQGQLRGVALARLLYELDEVWDQFQTDDRIEDAVERDLGVPVDTFYKYSRMYRFVLTEYDTNGLAIRERDELAGKPVEGLIKLTAAARSKQLKPKDWKALSLAHDVRAMIAVRDSVRGTHTSGHTGLSLWASPNGQTYCKRGKNGEIKQYGYLDRGNEDEDVKEAIARHDQIGVMFQ